jgi:flagellar motility protein MotE (MotC chaperone)
LLASPSEAPPGTPGALPGDVLELLVALMLNNAPAAVDAGTPAAPLVEAQPILPLDTQPAPPLTRKALCGELTKTNKELTTARAKLDAERKTLESERKELEKLKAEIATARAGLKEETDKLQALLDKRGDAPPATKTEEKPKATLTKPAELDGLAKTMKSMKPDAAAAVIQRSEPMLAAQLLKRMKPADAGAVMDRLKPDLAAELVVLMSSLPGPAPKNGGRL